MKIRLARIFFIKLYTTQSQNLTTLGMMALENNEGKGENAGYVTSIFPVPSVF